MRLVSMRLVKTIQIRNVPDRIHRELRTRAASAGVSLSAYVLEDLERLASKPTVADVLSRTTSRPGDPTVEEIVATIREMRGPID